MTVQLLLTCIEKMRYKRRILLNLKIEDVGYKYVLSYIYIYIYYMRSIIFITYKKRK